MKKVGSPSTPNEPVGEGPPGAESQPEREFAKTHPDFEKLIQHYRDLEGVGEEDRAQIIGVLEAVGRIFTAPGFHKDESIQAIVISGSYSRHDKMPRPGRDGSDIDILILEKPKGAAAVGLGVPDFIWNSYDTRTAKIVGEKLGVLPEIRAKISVNRVPASPRIMRKHGPALRLLQGGTLIVGEIIDSKLREEYGRLREGGLPERPRRVNLHA